MKHKREYEGSDDRKYLCQSGVDLHIGERNAGQTEDQFDDGVDEHREDVFFPGTPETASGHYKRDHCPDNIAN